MITTPDFHARRHDLVQRMAADLIRFDALAVEADSIRSLYGAGYSMVDVVMRIDEARALAFQDVAAKEMSEP